MTVTLPFTGERFTPEAAGETYYEHWHRYGWVLPLAHGKRVLDAACGEGYGTHLLSRVAGEAIGLDSSSAAIGHARRRYVGQKNLSYLEGSCTAIPLASASVDLIVSFETIEHLTEQAAMLAEFRRVLTTSGLVVLSSPNKPVYSEQRDYHNEYHLRELNRQELADLFTQFFPQTRWYGQRNLFHSLIWRCDTQNRSAHFRAHLHALHDMRYESLSEPAEPMYFILQGAAADVVLPNLAELSLFADREQSIYGEFERCVQAERMLFQRLKENQHTIAQQEQEIAQWPQQVQGLTEKLAGLERELTAFKEAAERNERDRQSLQRQLAFRESLAGWLRLPFGKLKRYILSKSQL